MAGERPAHPGKVLFLLVLILLYTLPLKVCALEKANPVIIPPGHAADKTITNTPSPQGVSSMHEQRELIIFDFNRQDELNQWRPVNDTVMGGISDSSMKMAEAGVLSFTGTVSLENNGGFASLQSRPSQYDLSGYQGISLRIRGDGKRYKFSAKSNEYLDSVRYEAAFSTEKDRWMTVTIPFSTLKPTFRGMMLTNEPPLNSGAIKSFSLLISDKQEGAFKLAIDWIKAYQ